MYVPKQGTVIFEMRTEEAYYAGFFRACELILRRQTEGLYAYVSTTDLQATDQCTQMVQYMIDHNAAHHYSRNWPGIERLSPRHIQWPLDEANRS
ncbi:hypothetical protein KFU94_45170 [Chloroflexi bacterium TSY]|nr:hypothetical protein [Chloroflexi bacterium TSY]